MTIFRSKVSLTVLLVAAAAGSLSAAVAQAAAKPKSYTVKPGDTLFSIARAIYGDQSMWAKIYRLNTDVISDPHWIEPGTVLKLDPSAARPAPTAETPAPEPVAQPAAKPAAVPAPPPPPAPAAPRPQEVTLPKPQPARPPVIIEPPADQQEPIRSDSLFARRRGLDARTALRTYREQPYRPLRRGEFFSAGYLTENDKLPFGRLLGTVTPQQIRNLSERATATLYTQVALEPPPGGKYQPGDSLLVVQTFTGPTGYGDIVLPTGMVRVTGLNGSQALASVVSVYGPIRNGQLTIPVEKFSDGGTSRAQPVEKGISGSVLSQREIRELKHPQDYLFINRGKKDGVARGDIFEVRRDREARPGTSDTADELMAVLQVVHVRERSATAKVLNVLSPDIPPGTRILQVGKLPQ